MKITKINIIMFFLLFGFYSCDSLLELEPEGEIIASEALKTPQDLQELLNSAYDVLRGDGGDFLGGRSQALSEVMGDNIDGKPSSLNNADFLAFYNKSTSFFTGYSQAYFTEPYFLIYRANVLLDNVNSIEELTDAEKDRISGEALFLRALSHFDLVKFFAHPYGFTPDNSHLGIALRIQPSSEPLERATVGEVYNQIVEDFQNAVDLLPEENDVYATSWAAKAMLAKVYFHMQRFQDAFDLANDVIENGPFSFNTSTDEYSERFSPDASVESVFRIVSNLNDHRGTQFTAHFRSDGPNEPTLRISRDMYNLATSDPDDFRGNNWFTIENEGAEDEAISITKFDNKEYFDVPVIHITELKFIRAESAAEINTPASITQAVADINDIRTRAGVSTISTNLDKATLLQIIRTEKRKELVAEGVRFHDLRRIGALEGDVLIRGAAWDCPGMSVQFPDIEIAGAGGPDEFTPNVEGGCNN